MQCFVMLLTEEYMHTREFSSLTLVCHVIVICSACELARFLDGDRTTAETPLKHVTCSSYVVQVGRAPESAMLVEAPARAVEIQSTFFPRWCTRTNRSVMRVAVVQPAEWRAKVRPSHVMSYNHSAGFRQATAAATPFHMPRVNAATHPPSFFPLHARPRSPAYQTQS